MELAITIIIAIAAVALSIFITNLVFRYRFKVWQSEEQKKWQDGRRKDVQGALQQSRSILGGKFTEQMIPFLPDFRYDPTEARFIGSPVDLIVFPGLAQGDPKEIVIVEVKTGSNARLTVQEDRIRQLIEQGMVRWELLQRPQPGD